MRRLGLVLTACGGPFALAVAALAVGAWLLPTSVEEPDVDERYVWTPRLHVGPVVSDASVYWVSEPEDVVKRLSVRDWRVDRIPVERGSWKVWKLVPVADGIVVWTYGGLDGLVWIPGGASTPVWLAHGKFYGDVLRDME